MWQSGDAIWYDANVTGSLGSKIENITIDNGSIDGKNAGKIISMQGYDYPNYISPVLTGVNNTLAYMPVKCQENVNFTETPIYSWMNGPPAKNSTNTDATI